MIRRLWACGAVVVVVIAVADARAQILEMREKNGEQISCVLSGLSGFGDSCGAEYYEQVFIGTIVSEKQISESEFRVTIRPEEVFRGTPESEVTSTTTQGLCLPDFHTGDRWLFSLRRDTKSKELMLDYGGASGPVDQETEMIARLRVLMSMKGAGMVRGDVSASEDPRPNHKIILRANEGAKEYVALTDKNGSFEFEPIPEGKYELIANSEPGLWSGDGGKTDVKSNECRDYHIRLQPDGIIRGRVTVDGARPAQTWSIDAVSADDLDVGRASAYTDDDGNFKLRGLGPGRYLVGIEIVGVSNFYYLRSGLYAPGVTKSSRALAVELGKGERREGIDIRIPAAVLCPEHCATHVDDQ